jgi:hypothetical protein
MSHFTKVKTKIKCLVTLQRVIEAMGFSVKENVKQCRGYQGELTDCDMVIDTKSSYDIGVVKSVDGYELIGDWDMLQVRAGVEQDEFVCDVDKKYAYYRVMDEVKKQGYEVIEDSENAEQVLTVKVRRWS